MEIQWLGHACFRITYKGYTVVIDPYDKREASGYPDLKVKADRLLVSHEHGGHNNRSAVILSGRPESDCPFKISTIETFHDVLHGHRHGECTIHILEADGYRIAHTGDLGALLRGSELEPLYNLDVIMIGAGSYMALPSQDAYDLVERIKPRIVIPMHYHDPDKHLCSRRLERIDDFVKFFPSEDMIHWYDTDTIAVDKDTEPQVAVLNYLGGRNGDYT